MSSSISLHDINSSIHSIAVTDGGGSLTVDAVSLDIRPLTNADVVTVEDGGGSITVDAVNLDIRDLAFASDSVTAHQGGTWVLGANSGVDIGDVTINNGSGAAAVNIQDGGNSITVDGSVTVSATDLDIRDLSHSQDSVKIGDGTDFLAINNDGSINVQGSITTTPDAYDVWQAANKTVTNTASQLDGTPLSGRLSAIVQNLSSQDVYIGAANTVTTSNGLLVPKHGEVSIDFGASAQIWAIAASGSNDVRLVEFAS